MTYVGANHKIFLIGVLKHEIRRRLVESVPVVQSRQGVKVGQPVLLVLKLLLLRHVVKHIKASNVSTLVGIKIRKVHQ